MNNSELNRLLKSASVPEPPQDYWEQFPGRVTDEVRRRRASKSKGVPHSAPASWSAAVLCRFRWALGTAITAALVLAAALLIHSRGKPGVAGSDAFAEAQKCFREIEPLFPNQIKAIVFDQQGAELVLADDPTVPTSTPLYLKVCGPNGCRRFVTFSGQQIRVNGDLCDVLLDREGNILVVGRQFAWSSSNPAGKATPYQIEARPLGTT